MRQTRILTRCTSSRDPDRRTALQALHSLPYLLFFFVIENTSALSMYIERVRFPVSESVGDKRRIANEHDIQKVATGWADFVWTQNLKVLHGIEDPARYRFLSAFKLLHLGRTRTFPGLGLVRLGHRQI